MWDWLVQLDREWLLAINAWHAPWADWLMIGLTDKRTWLPFYLALAVWLYWKFGWRALGFLLLVGAAIALSDQVSSAFLKPVVGRLRPCHQESLQPLLHLPLGCGGKHGFVSSHAANTFALALLLYLHFGKRYAAFVWAFAWAAAVSYSRIYLGAHFPADVMGGALLGMACAGLLWLGYCRLLQGALGKYVVPVQTSTAR